MNDNDTKISFKWNWNNCTRSFDRITKIESPTFYWTKKNFEYFKRTPKTDLLERYEPEPEKLEAKNTKESLKSDNYENIKRLIIGNSNTDFDNSLFDESDLKDGTILFNIKNGIEVPPKVLNAYIDKIINLSPYKETFPVDIFFFGDEKLSFYRNQKDYISAFYNLFCQLLMKEQCLLTEDEKGIFKFHIYILRCLILNQNEKFIEYLPIGSVKQILHYYQRDIPLFDSISIILNSAKYPVDTLSPIEKSRLLWATFDLVGLKNENENYNPFIGKNSSTTSVFDKIDASTIDGNSILFNIKNGIEVSPKVLNNYVDILINLSPYKDNFPIHIFFDSDIHSNFFYEHSSNPSLIFNRLHTTLNKAPFLVTEDEKGGFLFYLYLLRRIILNNTSNIDVIPIGSFDFILDDFNHNYSIMPLYNILDNFIDIINKPFETLTEDEKGCFLMLTYDLIIKKREGLVQ